jgi:hypothetical protein
MQGCILRYSMSVLLSATVLASSIMQPGFWHAHAGGNDPSHQHTGDSTAFPNLQHDALHTDYDEHRSGCQSGSTFIVGQALGQYAPHHHFMCLGFQLTLVDVGHSGKDSKGSHLANVRSSEYLRTTPQQCLSAASLLMACQTPTAGSVPTIHRVESYSQTVTTTLLCDRARHERSGVLLA